MYSRRFLCSILLTVLIFRTRSIENPSAYNHWDDYEVAFADLQRITDNTQKIIIDHSQVLSQQLVDISGNATEKYETVVHRGYNITTQQLNDLQVLADALGNSHCLEARLEELETLADDLIYDIQACMRHHEIEARVSITNISGIIYDSFTEVNAIRDYMRENCPEFSEDPEDVECIVIILGRIQTAKDVFPTRMLDESLRATLEMKVYEEFILECADSMSGLIYTQANQIVFEVEQCLLGAGKRETKQKEAHLSKN